MITLDAAPLALLGERHLATLTTLRPDGSPLTSPPLERVFD